MPSYRATLSGLTAGKAYLFSVAGNNSPTSATTGTATYSASWTGTAPIEASSGEIVRHRLSRAGNRRMNHMIHMAAASQLRHNTDGRAYYRRKLAAGKTKAEAMRCLKRRISDALYRQLRADASTHVNAGPGGHGGASLHSSAAGSHPLTGRCRLNLTLRKAG